MLYLHEKELRFLLISQKDNRKPEAYDKTEASN